MMKKFVVGVLFLFGSVFTFFAAAKPGTATAVATGMVAWAPLVKQDTATFATGCFWCTQAQFQQLKGVKKEFAGYSGGHVPHPTYQQVCTGTTGHAESCNIIYDPAQISFDELLEAFFVAHDPTTLNRQG